MKDIDCIFCKIVEGKIPSKIVFEDDHNLAFLDISPISRGHTIVIPKNHYFTLEDIPDRELKDVFQVVRKIAKVIYQKLQIDGYNILQNNFAAAGQVIKHFHIHIIPRIFDDNRFKVKIPRNQASDEELNDVLSILSS